MRNVILYKPIFIQSIYEYIMIVTNEQETSKLAKDPLVTLSSLTGSTGPSGLFPFMHRTPVTPVPIGKGVNYCTT